MLGHAALGQVAGTAAADGGRRMRAVGLVACIRKGGKLVVGGRDGLGPPCGLKLGEARRSLASKVPRHKPDVRRSIHRPLEVNKAFHKEIFDAMPERFMQSQMYTPEALRAEGLATNCHRMVHFGLSMPELMDRYAARAVELAPNLSPLQFSLILSAFARVEHRHEQMLQTFTKHIPPRLPNFLPMALSQTCNSYAKLRERDEALFRRFSSEMPHKLPHFEGFQLKNVMNAYARLDIRDDLLFDDIADEIMRRPEELCASDLTLLANSYGHFRVQNPRLWATFADWLLQSYLDLRPVDVAVVLNAYSTVNVRNEALISTLLQYVTEPPQLEELQVSTLCLVLNALARLRWDRDDQAMHMLTDSAVRAIEDLGAVSVTQLLHASTRIKILSGREELIEGLLARSRDLVPTFSAQSLSMLVHSCVALRQRDVPLLTLVAKAVPPKVKEFTPQALAMLARGFASLEVRSEILFYLLAGEVVDKMPLFSGQGVGMVLHAFGRLQIHNERLLRACRKQVRALADELTHMEVDLIEGGLRSLGGLDGATEALLRRVRRDLGAVAPPGRPAGASSADATGAVGDDVVGGLLRRLAEEPATRGVVGAAANVPVALSGAAARAPAEPSGESPAAQGGRPDIWALWGAGETRPASHASGVSEQAAPESSEDNLASQSSKIREYLARPDRSGIRKRRPVVELRAGSWGSATDDHARPNEASCSVRGADRGLENTLEPTPGVDAGEGGEANAIGGGRRKHGRRSQSRGA